MSSIVEVCCNGATMRGHRAALRLEYRPELGSRNVRLGLPRIVQDVFHIPNRTLDLLELAAYIYAADRHTRRGARDAVEFHSWSRHFRIRMRVRDPNFWKRPDVQESLSACLTFLTGDADFTFLFTGGHRTPPTSLFDQEGFASSLPGSRHHVALFSGGLDSLGGALNTLQTTDSTLVLVSHQSQPGTKQVQRQLARSLGECYPKRVVPYGFECTLSGVRAAEETQRSRSFLYSAIGFSIAQAYGCDALTVYENGVTSLNLSRREDLMNARASRTTHPRALAGVQELLGLVADKDFAIHTPAFWMTKRDIVDQIVSSGHGYLIPSSVSCSRTFQREGNTTHCGRCFQCLDRRLALFAAHREDLDDPGLYTLDMTRQPLSDGEFRTTAVDYLRQAARFVDESSDSFYTEYLSELADAFDALPMGGTDVERMQRVWELMRSHGENVRRGLLRIRELYDDPLSPLAPGSLLSLVGTREHLRPAAVRLADAISRVVTDGLGPMFRVTGPINENDLNHKLAALIGAHHELISEHPTMPFACARVVPDHTIVGGGLLVEAKFIRDGTPPSKASEGIAADLTKYPSGSHILFVVYDPERQIPDDAMFRRDIEKQGRCSVAIVR
jgi:7-cyano-7-deazaguanine synthase in queuosine biosynthesis